VPCNALFTWPFLSVRQVSEKFEIQRQRFGCLGLRNGKNVDGAIRLAAHPGMEQTIVPAGNRPDGDIGVQQFSSHGFRRRDVSPGTLDRTKRLVDLDGFFACIRLGARRQQGGWE